MNVERKLLWYKSSEPNPERHYWNFLIINEQREITQIKQRLYEQLQPVVAKKNIDNGKIFFGDLSYELFCLETPISQIDFSKVYGGKVKDDRRLQPRRTPEGWNDLIDKIFAEKFS